MDHDRAINRQSVKPILPWIFGLGAVLALAAVFTELAEDVWFREGFSWDAPVILAIHSLSRPWLDAVMKAITWSGETGAVLLMLGLGLWLIWKKRPVDAVALLALFGSAVILNTLMKLLFARPRPALFPPLVSVSGFSFPSGHVTASTAVFGFLAVLLWESKRRLWALICGLWVAAVAVSRIYLGVHYPSDTLAALIFTTLLLIVVFALRNRHLRRAAQ